MKNFASDSFVSSLSELDPDIKNSLYLLKQGLFIPEVKFEEIVSQYEKWLLANDLNLKSEDKIIERILGEDKLKLFYLPEGQNCYAGYLSNIDFDKAKSGLDNINKSISSLISATDFIHPKDKFLNDYDNIRIKRSPTEGTLIEYKTESQTVLVKETLIRQIAELLRSSKRFSVKHPEIQISLRKVVLLLEQLLNNARVFSKKKYLFTPEEYKSKNHLFKVISNLVLVFDGNYLIDAYELKGRNFKNKIINDLLYLKQKQKIRFLSAIELFEKNEKVFIKTKVKGKHLSIDLNAFIELISLVPHSAWMKKKVPNFYSGKDVLENIGSALKYADWVNISSLSPDKNKGKNLNRQNKYQLKFTPWTFKVDRKNMIVKFIEGAGN